MEPTLNQTGTNPSPSLKKNKAIIKPKLLILVGVIMFIVLAAVFIPRLINKPAKIEVGGMKDGVYTSFNATATGKVTKISGTDIEIENNGTKKSFKLSENVLITQKSLFDKLADLLIPEVEAQMIPPRPPLPADAVDTKAATNSSGIPNIPPAPRKSLEDIKVGDLVNLSLVKAGEADNWIVTGISVLP